jgi:predicted Rossmann fold nucleotide-binding protein DprA/Smf involved in DNA uptake
VTGAKKMLPSFQREVFNMSRIVSVIGSRSLPAFYSPLVSSVVFSFLARGYLIASGGAVGADSFALSAVLQQGVESRGVIYSAWQSASGFPTSVRPDVERFIASGGRVVWGSGSVGVPRQQVVSALLGRNRRLVSASSVLVAFLHGESRGSLYTVRQAVARGIPVIAYICGGGSSLPADLASKCTVINKEVI